MSALYLFLIHPYGNGFIIACPFSFFSSIFKILDENLFSCFFPSIFISIITFSLSESFTSMSASKASLVSTQLKPPLKLFQIFLQNEHQLEVQYNICFCYGEHTPKNYSRYCTFLDCI